MKRLFHNNGYVYVILREIPHHNFMKKDGSINAEVFNAWKAYLGADKVLKNQTHFVFCETVQDAVWESVVAEKC